ncbi:hypothetical protein AB0J83_10070 [Actinoplanes sp. NPDC049596]|uniref:hypothetical protein n=1 Tax=unclassified Actinoplanes TaxID=2626549 RepID=UPI0034309C8A
MLIAAGGGGSGITDWYAMGIPEMQELIQKPDTAKHYELLTGWKQSADLINEHRWQVQNYRDNLAAIWPPDRNAAAFAYLTRLDDLIKNLDDTYEAAIANHDAFASATLSIGLAQKDIQQIFDEYMSNAQALNTFNATQLQAQKADPGLPPEKPPVADGRQEELRQKAAALLSTVSSDLALAQVSIRTPTLYERQFKEITKDANDGDQYVAPPIPPVTPVFPDRNPAGSTSSRPSVTFPTSGPAQPIASPPGVFTPPGAITPPITATPQPGLILGGTGPTAVLPSPNPPPVTPSLPGGGSGPIASPGLLPPTPGFLPTGSTATTPPPVTGIGRGGVGVPREGLTRPGATAPGGLHVMPPGGVIGGAPGVGLGQPATVRPGAQRVNPVGGVIGGGQLGSPGNARGTATGGTGQLSGSNAPYGPAGSRRKTRSDGTEASNWDPDNPWKTTEGVDPVVSPPREQRIDPGPAIGLN